MLLLTAAVILAVSPRSLLLVYVCIGIDRVVLTQLKIGLFSFPFPFATIEVTVFVNEEGGRSIFALR